MVAMVIGFDLGLTENIGELSMSKVLVEAGKKDIWTTKTSRI